MIKNVVKYILALGVVFALATASAGSFTVSAGVTDISLPGTGASTRPNVGEVYGVNGPEFPSGELFGVVEYATGIADGVAWTFGVAAGTSAGQVLTGFQLNLPVNEAADADLFLATRVGVGTHWFADVFPIGTATLGLRGHNGLVLEGGVLVKASDFGFSDLSFAPLLTVGYSFSF